MSSPSTGKNHPLDFLFGYWLILVLCASIIILQVLSYISIYNIFDDAYMFIRYADHLVNHGKLAWNVNSEPTYGLTSILYLSIVIPIRLLLPLKPAWIMVFSSLFCGFLFIYLLTLLCWKYLDSKGVLRCAILLFIFIILAKSIQNLGYHFVTGMDTAFVLAYLTGYILLCKWYESNPLLKKAIWVGIVGGLAYFVRPDLLLFVCVIPFSLLVISLNKSHRTLAGIILGITLGVIALQILFAYFYFHSAFPLPFYAKGLQQYDESIRNTYKLIPEIEFNKFLLSHLILIVLIFIGILFNLKNWRDNLYPVEKGLLLGTILYLLYYRYFVLQIMHYHQRFYYPVLPALLYLACFNLVLILNKIPDSIVKSLSRVPRYLYYFLWVLFIYILFQSSGRILLHPSTWGNQLYTIKNNAIYRFYVDVHWYRLSDFSKLPDNLQIATTEIGSPAVWNPHKVIIDLSGLNENDFSHHEFSAEVLFHKYQPDLIYLPLEDYQQMFRDILNNPYFKTNYDYYPKEILHLDSMGIAIKKSSPYYLSMKQIADNRKPFNFNP